VFNIYIFVEETDAIRVYTEKKESHFWYSNAWLVLSDCNK